MASKRILGLDLGTTSIGWAYIIEGENPELSSIEQIGVRVNPLTVDEQNDFEKGKPLSTNANRTLKRGARRNLDRYQDRRKNLIQILKSSSIISSNTVLTESGKETTFETWEIRAKAVSERIEKNEFARVLLAINKKRGYKSSRRAKNEDEGQAIDGMAIAKRLYDEHLTPGQFVFSILKSGEKYVPDFYRSDLQAEFDAIWSFQKQFHPEILTDEFYQNLKGKGQRATSALFWVKYEFNTAEIKDLEDTLLNERTSKLNLRDKKKLQAYKWRNDAVTKKLEKEQLAYVLTDINSNLNNSSGYLGAISDRSKELYFNKETVGQYLFKQLKENRHNKLKNQVFYRQDYLDEFEAIWTEQTKYYSELTDKLKSEIRDVIIFYQRKLKSQKGLISFCELESKKTLINGKEKNIGLRVAPKSSHLFQEYKIWQRLNDVVVRKKGSKRRKLAKDIKLSDGERELFSLDNDAKQLLFNELNLKGNITANKVVEILGLKPSEWEINFTALDGNLTNKELYKAFLKIIDLEGYDVKDILKVKSNKDEVELDDLNVSADAIKDMVKSIFETLEIDASILDFNAELDGKLFENQTSYQLWHLLYSYEGDDSHSGNETLYRLLEQKFNFKREHAQILANISFQDDYGSLSTKALRKIYPYIKENNYSTACELAGYNHSKHSLTKEELENRQLKDKLQLLSKNSLRNPVVEKILNQMVNVVNTLIDKENDKLEQQGLPRNFYFDEIRIELARELKKNAAERKELDQQVRNGKTRNEKIAKIIQTEFGIPNPTRNDIIRYRLYEELKNNGYKDLYTNTYIKKEQIFSKEIDIEHIIPQSRLFDDSFSNKTLAFRNDNLKKGNRTATDYIKEEFGETNLEAFEQRVENLYKLAQKNPEEGISKSKYKKLLMTQSEIGDGFIERDLRETQYIAKKAKEMLFEITKSIVSTSGSITDRLREDWDLINVMKEINFPKYRALGLTEWQERKEGKKVEVIKDWTKRNDHRHHAMDALTVAFTKRNYIQYLNNLNARRGDKFEDGIRNTDDNYSIETTDLKISTNDVLGIERKELYRDEKGKLRFILPIPNFRQTAKEHLDGVIISHKAKNKVVTKNKNKISGKNTPQIVLTPRGQLHKETVYGQYHFYESKMEKVGPKFNEDTINMVANPTYRRLLLERLQANDNNPKKAFGGKNALSKTPILINLEEDTKVPEIVKLVWLTEGYSIRKEIVGSNPTSKQIVPDYKSIEKILDQKIRKILKNRLDEYDGNSQKAFSELDKNPIWLNKDKGIAIKRVTISGVSNALALHNKKDHFGNEILDNKGKPIPVDFVSTGNNHHVAIYRDEKGNLQEYVVSFFEAVERVNQGLPIIDKSYNHHLGWQFLFSMKQNELFVFPNERTGFNPQEIDLLDPKNKSFISPNLFRVQKIATKNYFFRHHLETTVENIDQLKDIAYKSQLGLNAITNILKIRTNHLGDIIGIGEY